MCVYTRVKNIYIYTHVKMNMGVVLCALCVYVMVCMYVCVYIYSNIQSEELRSWKLLLPRC